MSYISVYNLPNAGTVNIDVEPDYSKYTNEVNHVDDIPNVSRYFGIDFEALVPVSKYNQGIEDEQVSSGYRLVLGYDDGESLYRNEGLDVSVPEPTLLLLFSIGISGFIRKLRK